MIHRLLTGLAAAGIVAIFSVYLVINQSPQTGAQAADWLRTVIGAEAVAKLEEMVFIFQDQVTQFKYLAGLEKPHAPWVVGLETDAFLYEPAVEPIPAPVLVPEPTRRETILYSTATPQAEETQAPTAPPTSVPTRSAWQPAPALVSGRLPGEGIWTAYLRDSSGRAVAYRTFFQPDPQRPTTIVAVVAFNLDRTRLNFVLGTVEPGLRGGPRGGGLIDPEHLKPGVILAAFSGGFQTVHGGFGAMADRIVAVPPRNGLASIAIYEDGRVRMGEWGKDLQPEDGIIAWRQNCAPVVQNGIITAKVFNDRISDWGGTLDGQIVTMRSGLGISADGRTLYYFAGPGLGVPSLAQSMAMVGVAEGMQLEINNFWTHFTAIHQDGSDRWKVETLFPEKMNDQPARFLKEYTRDFFYVTTANP